MSDSTPNALRVSNSTPHDDPMHVEAHQAARQNDSREDRASFAPLAWDAPSPTPQPLQDLTAAPAPPSAAISPPDGTRQPTDNQIAQGSDDMSEKDASPFGAPLLERVVKIHEALPSFDDPVGMFKSGKERRPESVMTRRIERKLRYLSQVSCGRTGTFAVANNAGRAGKSHTIILLGLLATVATGQSVLLMDANCSNGKIADKFGIERSKTLTLKEFLEILEGIIDGQLDIAQRDLIQLLPVSNPDKVRLVASDTTDNALESYSTNQMMQFYGQAATMVHTLFIDCGNKLSAAENRGAVEAADIVFLPAQMDHWNSVEDLEYTLRAYEAQGIRDRGLVLLTGANPEQIEQQRSRLRQPVFKLPFDDKVARKAASGETLFYSDLSAYLVEALCDVLIVAYSLLPKREVPHPLLLRQQGALRPKSNP